MWDQATSIIIDSPTFQALVLTFATPLIGTLFLTITFTIICNLCLFPCIPYLTLLGPAPSFNTLWTSSLNLLQGNSHKNHGSFDTGSTKLRSLPSSVEAASILEYLGRVATSVLSAPLVLRRLFVADLLSWMAVMAHQMYW